MFKISFAVPNLQFVISSEYIPTPYVNMVNVNLGGEKHILKNYFYFDC